MSGMGICGDAAAEWAAVFGAGLAAGLGAALWLKELMLIRVTARNRPAILCMNLLLKVPPCWSSEEILDRRRQSCRRDLIFKSDRKGLLRSRRHIHSHKARMRVKGAAKIHQGCG